MSETLCFLQAFAGAHPPENSVPQSEYFQHLLAHFQGVRHPEDDMPSIGSTLRAIQPWVGSLREVALNTEYKPLSDISSYTTLFTACTSNDLDSFKSILSRIRSEPTNPDPLQPSACLAAQHQQSKILAHCFEQGAHFDTYLTRAAEMGAKTVAMLELLHERDWAGIRTSRQGVQEQIEFFGEGSFQAGWLRENADAGGEKEVAKRDGDKKKGTGKSPGEAEEGGKRRPADKKKGRDKSKGTGSRDPRQGPSPEQINEWFGDVPW